MTERRHLSSPADQVPGICIRAQVEERKWSGDECGAITEEEETDTHQTELGHKSRRVRTDTGTRSGAAAVPLRAAAAVPTRSAAALRPLPDTTTVPRGTSSPHHSGPWRLEDTRRSPDGERHR
ncbi:hypothetical protein Q8A73_003109 [Channa argus]|nr:hypothetical protein Q8A73_003109 [Channa argus]